MITRINEIAGQILPDIIKIRRLIHRNPELSFKEFKTSKLIRDTLESLGIPCRTYCETGIAALIGTGKRCVALRSDIDALPVTEETGLEYASANKGIMHACGHDLHTAMLLGAAMILKKIEDDIPGCVKLIFQPGEETLPGGASMMINEGVLENPAPEAIFGQHIDPSVTTGKISVAPGPIMAMATELFWNIYGKQAHAAQPQLGADPIIAASNLLINLQSVITKFRNPVNSAVLNITSINSGNLINMIPDFAEMKGILRSFDKNWQFDTVSRINDFTDKITGLYNTRAEFRYNHGYPPLNNDTKTTETVRQTASEIFGAKNTLVFEPKLWAEDFSYYTERIPGTFWFLGVRAPGSPDFFPIHNSRLNPDENAMLTGMAMLAAVSLSFLNKNETSETG